MRHALERVATVAVDAGAALDPATGRGAVRPAWTSPGSMPRRSTPRGWRRCRCSMARTRRGSRRSSGRHARRHTRPAPPSPSAGPWRARFTSCSPAACRSAWTATRWTCWDRATTSGRSRRSTGARLQLRPDRHGRRHRRRQAAGLPGSGAARAHGRRPGGRQGGPTRGAVEAGPPLRTSGAATGPTSPANARRAARRALPGSEGQAMAFAGSQPGSGSPNFETR